MTSSVEMVDDQSGLFITDASVGNAEIRHELWITQQRGNHRGLPQQFFKVNSWVRPRLRKFLEQLRCPGVHGGTGLLRRGTAEYGNEIGLRLGGWQRPRGFRHCARLVWCSGHSRRG